VARRRGPALAVPWQAAATSAAAGRWQRCGSVDLPRNGPLGEGGGRIGCGGWPEERWWRMTREKKVEASTEYGGRRNVGSD